MEDENHFLMECPAYQAVRPECDLENPTGKWGSTETFFTFPSKLAKFLREAYSIRNTLRNPPQYTIKDISLTGLQMTLRIRTRDEVGKCTNLPNPSSTIDRSGDGVRLKIQKVALPP